MPSAAALAASPASPCAVVPVRTPSARGTWITTEDAAKRAACCITTIRRAIRAGRLPAGRCGGQFRLKAPDVDAWLLRGAETR